ncbi:MAG: cytochrome c oxidase subunit II [Dehalococcoidia bacterium]|nr:cytochrome c oxidase subunit II [Dehalococcoidia bacterium]
MLRFRKTTFFLFVNSIFSSFLFGCSAWQSDPQTTVNPKSDMAVLIQDLYVLVFWLSVGVFIFIMGAIVYVSIRFRERPGVEAKQFHGNTKLEILWTLIPILIVLTIFLPTASAIPKIKSDAPANALQIDVVGKQWWFEFKYPELNITTANEIHIPVNRPVSFNIESSDVIHAFWIPQLGGKVDMMPGHLNKMWFTPTEARKNAYLGQCTEFCGTSHANMLFRVFVDEQEDFDKWVLSQQQNGMKAQSELAKEGEKLILNNIAFVTDNGTAIGCVTCHKIEGTNAMGMLAPDLTHIASRSTIAAGRYENTKENLIKWISNPSRMKPGVSERSGGMPIYEDYLTPEQIESIVTYLLELK